MLNTSKSVLSISCKPSISSSPPKNPDLILKSEIKNLTSVNLFDVYEGDKIAKDKKSYAMNFTICNDEKTLNDKEIHLVMDNIQSKFENKFNAILRDK